VHQDNQGFLHARFGLGENVLEPYKKTIDRWLWPDVFRGQDTSVSKAKQAISDYKKALGDPEGGRCCLTRSSNSVASAEEGTTGRPQFAFASHSWETARVSTGADHTPPLLYPQQKSLPRVARWFELKVRRWLS